MRRYLFIIVIFLFSVASGRAQEWEPIGTESFEALTSVEDGGLLLIRYPRAILRSTDTGITWSVVYEGGARLMGFSKKRKK